MSRKSDLYYKAERLEKELEAEKIISSDLLRKAAELQSQLKEERENTKELMIQFDLWLGSDHRSISEATVNEFLTSNPK